MKKITTVEQVQFNPQIGEVDYGTNVTLSCDTIGAQILYKIGEEDEWREGDTSSVTITITNDVTIFAKAKVGNMVSDEVSAEYIVKYKVQFEENGGDPIDDIPFTSENSVSLRNITPIKTGYDFKGWYSDSNFADEFLRSEVSSGDAKDGVIKLYAKWEPITYTVVFNASGEVVIPSAPTQNFTYDVSQNLMKNVFTRDGYTFVGWNTEEDGSGTSYTDEQKVKNLASIQDTVVTLYAQWKKIESTIEIKFNKYSDVLLDPVTNDASIITITIPSGYSVVAWEKDGEKINGSEGEDSITVSEWDGGIYTVTIIFTDDAGKFYSYEMQVTIN